jgi:signal transduction histidine kinase
MTALRWPALHLVRRPWPKLRFRSLRVQVLLWTIVPLIIVLLILSLTGVGSHQFSVRKLVTEENINLIDVATQAVQARIELYRTVLAAQAGAAGTGAAGTAALTLPGSSLPPLEVWRIRNDGLVVDAQQAPVWVTAAVAAAAPVARVEQPWLGFDAGVHRIVWVVPQADASGWLVGSIPGEGLGVTDLFTAADDGTAPTIAVVDAAKAVIDANDGPAHTGARLDVPEIDQALLGERGVHFDADAAEQAVTAFAPIPGTQWAMIIRRPITDLIAPFFRLEQVLPLMLVAAAVVSFLTLYFGLSLVVRPAQSLVAYAERIGQGDFSAAAQGVGGLQEIEELRLALDIMARRLQSEQTALQDYLRAITNAQEEERARLARELHDETVQTLIALDHKAQLVQRGLDKHPERTREQVAELRKITSSATQEVRRLSYGLRPLCLEEIGLDSALDRLAQEAGVEYCCLGHARRLSSEKELALYRIAQESLSNARRHARASRIRMLVVFGPAAVTVGIGDNGQGFSVPPKLSDLTQNGHFGLMGITERTELIGGRLYCEAQPGQGAVVIVQAACGDGRHHVDEAALDQGRRWLSFS